MPFRITKARLAILLSQLRQFEKPKLAAEQYSTDPEAAAEILWLAYMRHDVENKKVADLGCGTGILGIGALLLGAEIVYFVDSDKKALNIAKENLLSVERKTYRKALGRAIFIHSDIMNFKESVDVVLQNPPFGIRKRHADRPFLETAFKISRIIYSIHKAESNEFIEQLSEKNNFVVTNHFEFNFPIKASQKFHKRKIYRFRAGCWRLERCK